MKNLLITVAIALTLVGCDTRHVAHKPQESNRVEAYRVHQTDDTWLYYYIWYTTFNNQTSTYYATSSTPLTSYSAASFTRTETVPSEIANAENLGTANITEADIPANIEADISAQEAAYAEYAETQGGIDSDNGAAEGTVDSDGGSTDSGSYDSGGSDAGGGDSGGGGE